MVDADRGIVVYCHDDSQFDITLYRCRKLKEWGTSPFVMCNIDETRSRRIKDMQRWANKKQLFWKMDYDEYDPTRRGK